MQNQNFKYLIIGTAITSAFQNWKIASKYDLFREISWKCVRYFKILPDHYAFVSSFVLLSELIYLPFSQYIFPAVTHLVHFYTSLVNIKTILSQCNLQSTIIILLSICLFLINEKAHCLEINWDEHGRSSPQSPVRMFLLIKIFRSSIVDISKSTSGHNEPKGKRLYNQFKTEQEYRGYY